MPNPIYINHAVNPYGQLAMNSLYQLAYAKALQKMRIEEQQAQSARQSEEKGKELTFQAALRGSDIYQSETGEHPPGYVENPWSSGTYIQPTKKDRTGEVVDVGNGMVGVWSNGNFTLHNKPQKKNDNAGLSKLLEFETVTGISPDKRGTKDYQKRYLDWQKQSAESRNTQIVFTEDALRAASQRYAQTGELPPMGMGRAGAEARAKIINQWAQDIKTSGTTVQEQVAKQKALKASASELSKLQGQRGVVMAFAKTADKNLNIAEKLSDKVGRTGSPVINRWLLAGKKSIAGDADVAAFESAMRTAINEFAKVTSSATGGGVTSDQARKEVESMLNTAQTPEQVKQVIQTLRQEMENRKSSYDDQIQSIKDAMSSGNKPRAPQAAVEYLKQHPEFRGAFRKKYGYLPDGF